MNVSSPSLVMVAMAHPAWVHAAPGSTESRSPCEPTTLSTPPRWLVRGPRALTQTPSPVKAIPPGLLPTLVVFVTRFVFGSIRETVPPKRLATQTESGPVATVLGPRPTGMVKRTLLRSGSIRETVSSRLFAT